MNNKTFVIAYERLAVSLLPVALRQRHIIALISALVSIFSSILRRLGTYRSDKLEDINVTGQVCKLEDLLNRNFDAMEKRIRIADGDSLGTRPYLVYPRGRWEDLPLPRGQAGIIPQIILNSRDKNASIFADFFVLVPRAIGLTDSDIIRLDRLVATYKLQSKAFKIEII